MIIRMTIDVKIEESTMDEDEKIWMENEILLGNGSLILHSNEIGDELGEIKKVRNIQWIESID